MGKKKGNKGKKLDLSEFLGDKPMGSVTDTALPTVSRSRQVVEVDMCVETGAALPRGGGLGSGGTGK